MSTSQKVTAEKFVPVRASDIQLAQARISSEIAPTPLQYCPRLSEQTGCDVFLKREDLQGVRSYKIRGAFFSISNLTDEEKAAGIVTASAGNHAQGVADACSTMVIKGKMFIPRPTPTHKRDRIRVHGVDMVEVVVTDANFDQAAAAARVTADARGPILLYP